MRSGWKNKMAVAAAIKGFGIQIPKPFYVYEAMKRKAEARFTALCPPAT